MAIKHKQFDAEYHNLTINHIVIQNNMAIKQKLRTKIETIKHDNQADNW